MIFIYNYDSNVIGLVPIKSPNSVDLIIGNRSCYKRIAEDVGFQTATL